MTVTPTVVIPRYQAAQYDGTNAQELADWLDRPVMYDYGTNCGIEWISMYQQIDLTQGDWVIASTSTPPQYLSVCPGSQYTGQYTPYTPPA